MNIEQTCVNLDEVIEIRLLQQKEISVDSHYEIKWKVQRNPGWFAKNLFGETYRSAGFYSYGILVSVDEICKKYFIDGERLILKPRVVFDYNKNDCKIVFFDTFEEAETLYDAAIFERTNFLKVK
jgi:hypothetical protein